MIFSPDIVARFPSPSPRHTMICEGLLCIGAFRFRPPLVSSMNTEENWKAFTMLLDLQSSLGLRIYCSEVELSIFDKGDRHWGCLRNKAFAWNDDRIHPCLGSREPLGFTFSKLPRHQFHKRCFDARNINGKGIQGPEWIWTCKFICSERTNKYSLNFSIAGFVKC